ncbi:hypothetical protein RN001_001202 [Aquatica leii]|uniref:BZIP domain-containing protein n=1 Tax=Aquatica leii TaxID=1421715 RepID=A0AAN7PN91_9COLE|nr:hypothetical protein RN001_001202 [Aquatica leii]
MKLSFLLKKKNMWRKQKIIIFKERVPEFYYCRMAPKRGKGRRDSEPCSGDDSDEYRKKRDRNNLAVKRSRIKSKQKTQETVNRVTQLKNENSVLEEKVKNLTKELGFLKELFLAHASSTTDASKFEGVDLQKLLSDDPNCTGATDLNKTT